MTSLVDKVGYYVDKLILQYRTQPKARQQMAIMLKQVMADDLISQFGPAFDIDTAVGAQLDIIGKYAGVSRNIGIAAVVGYFGFWRYASARLPADYQGQWEPVSNTPTLPDPTTVSGHWYGANSAGTSTAPIAADWQPGDTIYSDGTAWIRSTADNANGFISYGDSSLNRNAIWLTYAAASRASTALPDSTYRTIIKLKIIINQSDGTLAAIVNALYAFFPGLITVEDTADMHLSYTVVSTLGLSKELLMAFLPKPMGVGISVTIVSPSPGGGDSLTTEGGDILTTEGGDPLTTEGS